jgi:hypothetical protein
MGMLGLGPNGLLLLFTFEAQASHFVNQTGGDFPFRAGPTEAERQMGELLMNWPGGMG